MAKLSLCIIVKNEEENLPRCLNSVKNIVDEIILLDTGSSDNTIKIAQEYNAKIHHFKWNNDFSDARNESLKYATGEWIIILDADEELNPNIIQSLAETLQTSEVKNTLVINLLRYEVGANQSPYSLVSRLFRNHPKIKFNRPYHSLIDDSVTEILTKENHWQIINFPIPAIFHYGYQTENIKKLDKFSRAKKTLETYLQKFPKDPYTCNKLGALYLQEGNLKKALKLLKNGIDSHKADPITLYELYYHLGNAYTKNNEIDKAIKTYQNALRQPILEPLKIGAYNNLGGVLKNIGALNYAQQAYENMIHIAPDLAMGYYNLGMVLKDQRKYRESIQSYEQAIKLNPHNGYYYQNLGVVFLKTARIHEALEMFQKAINLHREQNNPEAQRLQEELKQMKLL
jgi:glycosyltransferase involved in cell wall biosynthesis